MSRFRFAEVRVFQFLVVFVDGLDGVSRYPTLCPRLDQGLACGNRLAVRFHGVQARLTARLQIGVRLAVLILTFSFASRR